MFDWIPAAMTDSWIGRKNRAGKLVYLFFYAAGAVMSPQLGLYYRSIGLSGRQVGILSAVVPAASILGASFWGVLSDATGRHRLLLTLTMIGAAVFAQAFMAPISFLYLLAVALLFSFSVSPVMPIIDSSVLEALGDGRDRYGRSRLWGAVGWGVAAPLAGLLIGRAGSKAVFPLYGFLLLLCLAGTYGLPVNRSHISPGLRRGMGGMLRNPRWVFFLFVTFVMGFGGSFINSYLFIYLEELGASAEMRGLALAAATVSELLMFFGAHRLLKRFGPERIMLISLGATGLRLFLYYLVHSPAPILAVQLFHGLTFSVFLVAGVTLARDLAPEGMETTAQGLFTATHFGLGGIVGSYVGGELLDLVGVHSMYLIASICIVAGLAAFILFRGRGRAFPGRARL